MQRATFAAGCYWGTEKFFRKEFGTGIQNVKVGFMGGEVDAPTYRQVCTGQTGHAEVLTFEYDTDKIRYDELVWHFFRLHNPTTKDRQGNDVGTQYRSSIFYHNDEQKAKAEAAIAVLNDVNNPRGDALRKTFGPDAKVVTTIEKAQSFFPADEDHQDYLAKNPTGYCNHRLYW
jgi:peptide-methionine (S)-S-oxide reductase